jgi:NADPH:quinone reductase-like Zn-dependent oxidoreductase
VDQVPANLTLEAAATVPDNFVTAFYVIFDQLKLPIPKELPAKEAPPNPDIPILVYGSGSTSGQYTIQLLKLAGYTRIITTASPKHHASLHSYGATHIIDYNSPTLIDDITKAAGGKVKLALDCISAEGTTAIVSKVIDPEGTVCLLLPIKQGNAAASSELFTQLPEDNNPFAKSLNIVYVSSFMYQKVRLSIVWPFSSADSNSTE